MTPVNHFAAERYLFFSLGYPVRSHSAEPNQLADECLAIHSQKARTRALVSSRYLKRWRTAADVASLTLDRPLTESSAMARPMSASPIGAAPPGPGASRSSFALRITSTSVEASTFAMRSRTSMSSRSP